MGIMPMASTVLTVRTAKCLIAHHIPTTTTAAIIIATTTLPELANRDRVLLKHYTAQGHTI